MERDAWRLVVRLKSRRVLCEFATFKAYSVRALADAAKRTDGTSLKPAVVGHLMSGKRSTCSLATARAIEEALGVPHGFLFDPSMSKVADDGRLHPMKRSAA